MRFLAIIFCFSIFLWKKRLRQKYIRLNIFFIKFSTKMILIFDTVNATGDTLRARKNESYHLQSFKKCKFSPVHTTYIGHDSKAICDHNVITHDSIAIREFKPHFLANHVCFDNLRASLVGLRGFSDHVNKTKKRNHCRTASATL